MIVVDMSVIREWLCRHDNVKNALVVLIGFFFVYYFFIREVVCKYSDLIFKEKSLYSHMREVEIILGEDEEKRKDQEMKIFQIEKESVGENEFNIPSLSVSEIYRSCGVVQYSIMDASGASSGGHGRPILTTISHLRYSQVLCVLSNLSKKSDDIEFKSMTLGRDEKDPDLKFVMDVGVF